MFENLGRCKKSENVSLVDWYNMFLSKVGTVAPYLAKYRSEGRNLRELCTKFISYNRF